MRIRHLALVLGGAVLSCFPATQLPAQTGECRLVQTQEVARSVVGGEAVVHVQGPLLVRCAAGEELRADSAVLYPDREEYQLYRNVSYRDAERHLTANRGSYFAATGRVHALGSVVFRDQARNSTLRGPELEYFRPMEGRPEPRVNATGRPRLVALPTGDAAPGDSVVVDADRISTVGEEQLTASGAVVIRRPDMTAYGNTAFYDTGVGRLDLEGDARVEAEGLELRGQTVRADLPGETLEHVSARREAELTGDDLTVRGDALDLFFEDDVLQRLVSRGAPGENGEGRTRTEAITTDFRMEADSLDALLPAQVLERVVAVGNAFAESLDVEPEGGQVTLEDGRSLPTDRDWIRGDTITGFFARAAASPELDGVADPGVPGVTVPDASADDRDRVELERLVAVGTAGTLFRAREDDDDPDAPPSLNYVAGRQVELVLVDGELEVANVEGLRRGVFLDVQAAAPAAPLEDEVPEDGDSTAAPEENR